MFTGPTLRAMSALLEQNSRTRLLLLLVIGTSVSTLALVSLTAPAGDTDPKRVLFWALLTLLSAALPVKLPGGVVAHTTTTPIIAAMFDTQLANPVALAWIAFVGTTELRDIRRQLPWFGTLYNRSAYLLSALAGWYAAQALGHGAGRDDPLSVVLQLAAAGLAFTAVNQALAVTAISFRTGQAMRRVWSLSIRNVLTSLVAQVPLGWLMAEVAVKVGLWAALMVIIPLQLARYSLSKYTELRDLFYGSVSALSQAIDAKDGFTRGHADRVSRIAGAIARELAVSEREIEHIELAALLHDIGKIGVEDRVLMKPSRLDVDETELMRRHPIYGASILEPSAALRPLVPIVLAHHENYDGSGYPNGLKREEIPLGARIILVSDAYEAMTSDRIYRKAIGHQSAMEQLHKYQGIQFDPAMVAALERLLQKHGVAAFEVSDLPPIEYETLAQLRRRLGHVHAVGGSHAG